MINRQAIHGADAKSATAKTSTKTSKTTPRTKPTQEEGARTKGKAKGHTDTAERAAAPRGGAWHGDEVSPSPLVASSAEEAAARAEGNEPIRADLEARDPDHGTYTEKGPRRRPKASDPDADENAEEKRQSAVEEHAALPSRHFPHGRL